VKHVSFHCPSVPHFLPSPLLSLSCILLKPYIYRFISPSIPPLQFMALHECTTLLTSFPALPHLQLLIAYSIQKKKQTFFSLQATKTRDGLFCILQAIKTGGEKPWEQGYHPANAITNCSWDQRRTGVHKGTAGAYKSKFSSCRHAPKVVCY